jgi:UrcA family protein
MTTLTARIASVATLALAALPIAALSTAAHAAPSSYGQESVRVSDLNLATASGKTILAQRVDHAVRHFCSTEKDLGRQAACQTAVQAEANEKAAANTQFASRN